MDKHIDLQNPHYCKWLDFLRKSEKWDKEQVAEYQLSEIKRIVRYAYENTKGYRRLYDNAGIKPDSIKTIEDFRRLPFMTKEMIRDNLEDFSVKIKDRRYVTTGGSTGIPCGFYWTKASFGKELASKAHQYYRRGWKEGDKQMVFRGLIIDTPNHMKFHPEFNELRCSTYYFKTKWLESYRKKAFEYKPDWIKCYPSAGYIFARFLKETGRPFPPIKGILCTTENLYDFQKELLSEVFKTKVFSHYGQYEMVALAGYCEIEDTYHVLPQYSFAELIDKNGNLVTKAGETGEIVGTSFLMDGTPFIRYKTRDLASLKGWGCSACSRPYQIWGKIEGRLQEFIVTKSGHYISIAMLNFHNDIYNHVQQIQFYQKEKGKVTFKFIPKESCNEKIIRYIKKQLMMKLNNDVDLEMKAVRKIPLTLRGKYRFLVQKMKLKFGDD